MNNTKGPIDVNVNIEKNGKKTVKKYFYREYTLVRRNLFDAQISADDVFCDE
jgi:hypothetical protein